MDKNNTTLDKIQELMDTTDLKDVKVLKKVQFHPVVMGPVSTLEELDIRVLQFQNKKLAQRLEQRKRSEAQLKQRIEQLEKRQTQDDAVLNVVNRYWNQLNEDIRVQLQRFNAETTDESENMNECEATTSFLMQLSSWDKEELDEKLANRVQVSKRAVAKIIQAFDRMLQRYEKIAQSLKECNESGESVNLEEFIKENYIEIQTENKELHQLNTSLHQKYHAISLKLHELEDTLNARETETAELRNRLDDAEYEHEQLRTKCNKLEHYLAEEIDKVKNFEQICEDKKEVIKPVIEVVASPPSNINYKKIEELQESLEEQRELANNRLQELEMTSQKLRDTLKECEQLRTDLRQLPESIIVETTEYKCLQSQFSVLYNESMQLRTQLEESHIQIQNIKHTHLRQIEMMESDELMTQKKLRTDLLQLEDKNAQLRKEYEMLRVEYEQTIVANEQSGPITREMRNLITSLQKHNQQLKSEAHRYKRKYKDINNENLQIKKDLDDLKMKITFSMDDAKDSSGYASKEEECGSSVDMKDDKQDIISIGEHPEKSDMIHDIDKSRGADKTPKKEGPNSHGANASISRGMAKKLDTPNNRDAYLVKETKSTEWEIRDLKMQLKKSLSEQKDLKLLLDMYKGLNKEHRDKTALMASEKKLRAELDELRQQLRKVQECKKEDRKKEFDDTSARRLRHLEEVVQRLEKANKLHKAEEEASLCEMEVTGQAFEDMQEQNSRLIQQLREKDDANFKLMTERIKSNQLCKISREEKETLQEMVTNLTTQIESINVVVRKLEEKERVLQNCVSNMEKELNLCRQALEMHKRKAIESAQSASDLKMHLEKYHSQMKEAQQVVTEKTSSLESEAYKTNRLQEEIAQYKRKVERMKKIEAAETLDAVLMEEIKEYKETLTCPSCKVKRKDAVLIKCFHVFCWDCLRTRYETRQRKCPKCNAAFGANDYHRLYLGN